MNRRTTSSWRLDSSATFNMLSVSNDGYIRLSFVDLQTISLIHLISGLDEDSPTTIPGGATPTEIMGYTEWVSSTAPAITIGWDWQMDADHNHILLRKISEPRNNIMLQDSTGMDVGPAKTLILLEAFIDALDWSIEVRNHIDIRYSK